jgi:hypothetical protein
MILRRAFACAAMRQLPDCPGRSPNRLMKNYCFIRFIGPLAPATVGPTDAVLAEL